MVFILFDEDWEYQNHSKIEIVSNPGWHIIIGFKGTPLKKFVMKMDIVGQKIDTFMI